MNYIIDTTFNLFKSSLQIVLFSFLLIVYVFPVKSQVTHFNSSHSSGFDIDVAKENGLIKAGYSSFIPGEEIIEKYLDKESIKQMKIKRVYWDTPAEHYYLVFDNEGRTIEKYGEKNLSKFTYLYDKNGRLIKDTRDNYKQEYLYNNYNELIEARLDYSTIKYEYLNGKLISEKEYNLSDTTLSKEAYFFYDSAGKLINYRIYGHFYKSDGFNIVGKKMLFNVWFDYTGTEEVIREVRYVFQSGDSLTTMLTYKNNRPVEKIETSFDNKMWHHMALYYDKNGTIVQIVDSTRWPQRAPREDQINISNCDIFNKQGVHEVITKTDRGESAYVFYYNEKMRIQKINEPDGLICNFKYNEEGLLHIIEVCNGDRCKNSWVFFYDYYK